jgi:hypothetical protein
MDLTQYAAAVAAAQRTLDECIEKQELDAAREARNLALYRATQERPTEPLTALCREAGVSRSYGGRVVRDQGRPDHRRAARR